MAVRFYMDHHVPVAVSTQLRRRGVDVLTAYEDGRAAEDDPKLLERSTELGRVLVSFDSDFRIHAADWLTKGWFFSGVLFRFSPWVSIGSLVVDLELIAKASNAEEWENRLEKIPL
jgi:hypothetical protein